MDKSRLVPEHVTGAGQHRRRRAELARPWPRSAVSRKVVAGNWEGGADMMHFSCDLCGKQMASGARGRYVIKMEVFAAHDPTELTDEDLDADHLDEISQVLADDETAAEEEIAPAYKKLRYDVCPTCHKKFLSDPLGREAANKFDFSEN